MILDDQLKKQLKEYMALMENDVLIRLSVSNDEVSKDIIALVDELIAMSPKIKKEVTQLERTPSFSVDRPDEVTGIVFAGVPLGHEFASLILALLQVSGRAPKIEDSLIERIKNIQGKYDFETYVSLTCHNCPDVVQALNIISLFNKNVTHTMVEGGAYKKEVEEKDIMAVPAVFLDGEFFEGGRMSLEKILDKMGENSILSKVIERDPYDVLVVGGGPAGASAAVYAARKGIRTGVVSERFGGQVLDTMGIENFISIPYTEGPKLAASLEEHVRNYDVDILSGNRAKQLSKSDFIEIELDNGSVLRSRSVILSTGARWRELGVPGEGKYKNKGVAYCPHCDGPLYRGKDVAVVGGGNSGVEAAIDLAGIVKHVTVIEFLPQLKADAVLQDKLKRLSNVTVITNAQVKSINGEKKVSGITYIERDSLEEFDVAIQGVFIQIGLVPNTQWLDGSIERNEFGEILTDKHNATDIGGVFAAGDCTDTPYKQIIISMGAGANAALSAFDHLIRNS